jgi:hypothetical protein
VTGGVYIKNVLFSVFILLFIHTSYCFVPVAHFPLSISVFISVHFIASYLSFFLSFFLLFIPYFCLSSFKILFHVSSLFSFLILLRLSLFLPSFSSLEMSFTISCVSTVFTDTRPEP